MATFTRTTRYQTLHGNKRFTETTEVTYSGASDLAELAEYLPAMPQGRWRVTDTPDSDPQTQTLVWFPIVSEDYQLAE